MIVAENQYRADIAAKQVKGAMTKFINTSKASIAETIVNLTPEQAFAYQALMVVAAIERLNNHGMSMWSFLFSMVNPAIIRYVFDMINGNNPDDLINAYAENVHKSISDIADEMVEDEDVEVEDSNEEES